LSTRDLYIKKIYNAILILINKLIKYVTYIATIKEFNIKDFVKLYRKNLYTIIK